MSFLFNCHIRWSRAVAEGCYESTERIYKAVYLEETPLILELHRESKVVIYISYIHIPIIC